MQPLGTKVYLLKRYSPSDRFCTFLSESVQYIICIIHRFMCLPPQKDMISKSSTIELTDLDQGVSYCFNIQVYIPTRALDKQHGKLSHIQCSPEDGTSFFEGNAFTL